MKIKNIIITILTLAIGVAEAWAQDQTLTAGTIYTVNETKTINGTLTVTAGAPVTIYIPAGITLTINGSDAGNGYSGINGDYDSRTAHTTNASSCNSSSTECAHNGNKEKACGGAGGTGAKPAIYVPTGATLIITGEGTLIAKGGNAGNGGYGGDAENAHSSLVNHYAGAGGAGGGGGGGAAAAIGGAGGNGGSGGYGGEYGDNVILGVVGSGVGGAGGSATSGDSGTSMGEVWIVGNVTVNATSGTGSTGTTTNDGSTNNSTHTYNNNGIIGQGESGWIHYNQGGNHGIGGFQGSAATYAIGSGAKGGDGGNGGKGGDITWSSSPSANTPNDSQSYMAQGNVGNGNGNIYKQNTTLNSPNLGTSTYSTMTSISEAQMPDAIKTTFTMDYSETQYAYYGTKNNIDLTTIPTKTGYTFKGYRSIADVTFGSTSAVLGDAYTIPSGTLYYDENGKFVAVSTDSNGNFLSLFSPSTISLVAEWEANTYTVTFNPKGGSVSPTSKDVTYNATYGDLPTSTRTGYTFNGWFTEETNGTQVTSSTTVQIIAAQTLYAHWTAKTYTVNLNIQGGTGGTTSVSATYDSAMPSATAPTKTGYTFAGYYTEENGGGTKYYNADMSSAHNWDIDTNPSTLYAKWTPKTYTVNLDMQDGSGGTAQVTATFDSAMPSATAPTKTGYTFAGYYTSTNGGGTQYYNADMSSANTWNIDTNPSTLYAKWTAKTYTVNLDMQDGSGGTVQVTATFDSAMPSAIAPSRTGYTFGGYYSAPNGEGTPYYDENMASAHNWNIATTPSTIYAYWEAISYQVTYDANGGLINGNSTFTQGETYDATYSLPEYTPTLNNYEFLGWFTSEIPSQGDKVTTETTVAITEAQTLYAHWSPISVEAYSAETQLGGNYFRTFFDSQVAHELPTGVTAYKGKIEGDYFMLTAIDVTAGGKKIIPKNVPVILRMEPNNDAGVAIPEYPYQITKKQISLTTSESELTIDNTDNELIGSDVTIASAIANSYILSFGSHGLGFYEWSTHPLEAHKAYVIKAPSNPAKALIFRFENDVTGINEAIKDFKSDDSNIEIYNLNGIRLSKPQKGINIINGKKVWVK